MDRDSQSTNRSVQPALHNADRPTAVGATRGRPYAAVAAVVAIVLMSALVFSTLAARLHPGPGHGITGLGTATVTSRATTPTAATVPTATPTPSPVPLPAGMSVINIAMVSADDGWAIAAPTASSTALVHHTGGRWMLLGDSYLGIYLTDISMDAHDDGWAVGGHTDQVSGGVVLHYSAGRWDPVPTPAIPFLGQRVWAFSPEQVLVLASLHKGPTGAAQSALLHYDHGAWTLTASPLGITDMSVLSADDVWATCFDGHILHEQGGRWTTYTIGGQASGLWGQGQPLSITMLSDSEGWAAGLINVSPQGMYLAHFDGHAWTRVQGPAASGPTEIHTIAMVSPTEGWAGGDLGNATGVEAVLLHYQNGQWQTAPVPSLDIGGIGRIVMLSASEGWAAAGGGAGAGPLHYQNGHWTPYQKSPSGQ